MHTIRMIEMKKILIAIVIIFPLSRAWLMNDFLFPLLFQVLNLKHSMFYLSFKFPEHFSAQIAIILIWLSFYLPFFIIFSKGKRLEMLKIFTPSLSITATLGLIGLLVNIIHPLGWWLPLFTILTIIVFPVFIVETVALSFRVDEHKNIGFLKSLIIAILSFLILPFLLVSGIQMAFG